MRPPLLSAQMLPACDLQAVLPECSQLPENVCQAARAAATPHRRAPAAPKCCAPAPAPVSNCALRLPACAPAPSPASARLLVRLNARAAPCTGSGHVRLRVRPSAVRLAPAPTCAMLLVHRLSATCAARVRPSAASGSRSCNALLPSPAARLPAKCCDTGPCQTRCCNADPCESCSPGSMNHRRLAAMRRIVRKASASSLQDSATAFAIPKSPCAQLHLRP